MLKQRKRDDDDVAKHSERLHDGSGNHQLIHHIPGFIVSDGFTEGSVKAAPSGFSDDSLLVPLHSDFDWLNVESKGQISSGRCLGSTSTSMLRGILGCLLMNPARSSVSTIW